MLTKRARPSRSAVYSIFANCQANIADAHVADLARAHHVVQRGDRLLDGRGIVEAVNLVEIHVIRAQPPQAIVDGVKDVLARESPEVGIVAHRLVNLGGDHNSVAAADEIAESPPHDLLANPDRIHIGGI